MECDEELPPREAEALAALRASPLVKEVGLIDTGGRQGVYARLWCARECHPHRYSEQLKTTKARTSLAECAEELLDLINQKHGDHLEAAERERSKCEAEAAAAAGPSAPLNAWEARPMRAAQRVQPAADLAAAAERAAAELCLSFWLRFLELRLAVLGPQIAIYFLRGAPPRTPLRRAAATHSRSCGRQRLTRNEWRCRTSRIYRSWARSSGRQR